VWTLVSLTNVKRPAALALMAIAIVVLGAACGDGDGLSEEDERATAAAIIAEGLPTEAEPPDFDPATVELQAVQGRFDSYTIEIPEGWVAEDAPAPDGFSRRYILDHGQGPVAQISVRCSIGADAETLIWQDNQIATNFDALRASFELHQAVDVTVGGLEGRQVDFSIGLPGGTIEQRAVYLDGDQCGWRMALWVMGLRGRDQYAPLFERVLDSFEVRPFDAPPAMEPIRPTPTPDN
jgi:hypothetical protein